MINILIYCNLCLYLWWIGGIDPPLNGQAERPSTTLFGELNVRKMKEIKLNDGSFTLVDDDDYGFLNQWKWRAVKHRKTTYVFRVVRNSLGKRTRIWMHRLILNTPTGMFTDHIDHNGLNNQRNNIRICTNYQNKMNVSPTGKSGLLGVYFEQGRFWRAKIRVNKKAIHLGVFATAIEASRAYDKAALKYFGEFANPNNL